MKEKKTHNKLWFRNRIGKKIYCTDHQNENKDYLKCQGIELTDCNYEIVMKNQERGIEFSG